MNPVKLVKGWERKKYFKCVAHLLCTLFDSSVCGIFEFESIGVCHSRAVCCCGNVPDVCVGPWETRKLQEGVFQLPSPEDSHRAVYTVNGAPVAA